MNNSIPKKQLTTLALIGLVILALFAAGKESLKTKTAQQSVRLLVAERIGDAHEQPVSQTP